jgi:hypothetical protein
MRNGSGSDSIFHGIKPYCGGGQPDSEAVGCLESAEQVLSLSERPEKPLETKESGGCWPLPVSSTGQLDAEGAGSKADSGPGSGNLGCINQGRRIACGLKPPRIYSSPAAAETAKGDWVESRAEC